MKASAHVFLALLALAAAAGEPSPADAVALVRSGDRAGLAAWLARPDADPNKPDPSGWTPLLLAAARGNADLVRLLLENPEHPADPGIRYAHSQALPVHFAAQSGSVETVRLLLDARPRDLEERFPVNGHTPLLQAVFYNRVELTKCLLARGANPAATTLRGLSALDLARQFGNAELIDLLEPCAPSPEAVARDHAENLAHIRKQIPAAEVAAQAAVDTAALAIKEALTDAGMSGTPPAQLLARLRPLLDACDVNRLAGDLHQPLIVIAVTGLNEGPHNDNAAEFRAALVKELLARGADPLKREKHPMATHAVTRAAAFGHATSLSAISATTDKSQLAAALNDLPHVNGFTALHDAVMRAGTAEDPDPYLETIRWARKHGARHDLEDFNGTTQRQHAEAIPDPARREATLDALK